MAGFGNRTVTGVALGRPALDAENPSAAANGIVRKLCAMGGPRCFAGGAIVAPTCAASTIRKDGEAILVDEPLAMEGAALGRPALCTLDIAFS